MCSLNQPLWRLLHGSSYKDIDCTVECIIEKHCWVEFIFSEKLDSCNKAALVTKNIFRFHLCWPCIKSRLKIRPKIN
ncbi:Hypothetical predicted protein [Podarcis lilfordi]|uniref:Uncharacterized protein n=1 Tax=Podarcis lilfordi TaxID=74358 RepID=A0AA35KE25_9SAUR|nr:Hypothetical predicted protein [Podarcis lilfordi]